MSQSSVPVEQQQQNAASLPSFRPGSAVTVISLIALKFSLFALTL